MRKAVLIAVCAYLGASAHADPFRARLNEANGLLRSGNLEGAISAYRELQIEEPESAELYYNLGCARFQQELKETPAPASSTQEETKQPFAESRASFEKAMTLGSGQVRQDAAFNRANCLAQAAKNMPQEQGQEQLVAAFQESIKAYEDVLRQFPSHEGSQQNLDHMRYLLKKMLQNPPQPPDQKQQGGGENKPQEEHQQQNQEQSQQNSGQEEQQQQQQQDQSKQKPQQNEQQKDSAQSQPEEQSGSEEQKQPEQTPQESAAEAGEREDTQEERETKPAGQAQRAPDRQTLEALLQSLEERDETERRLERRQQREPQLKGEWW